MSKKAIVDFIPVQGAASTWDATNKGASITLSGGNLVANRIASTGATWNSVYSTIPHSSGKRYFEFHQSTHTCGIGLAITGGTLTSATVVCGGGFGVASCSMYWFGTLAENGITSILSGSYGVGAHILSMAVDLDNGKGWYAVDGDFTLGGSHATSNPATAVAPYFTFTAPLTLFPCCSIAFDNTIAVTLFTQGTFSYTPPSGFSAWDS